MTLLSRTVSVRVWSTSNFRLEGSYIDIQVERKPEATKAGKPAAAVLHDCLVVIC